MTSLALGNPATTSCAMAGGVASSSSPTTASTGIRTPASAGCRSSVRQAGMAGSPAEAPRSRSSRAKQADRPATGEGLDRRRDAVGHRGQATIHRRRSAEAGKRGQHDPEIAGQRTNHTRKAQPIGEQGMQQHLWRPVAGHLGFDRHAFRQLLTSFSLLTMYFKPRVMAC